MRVLFIVPYVPSLVRVRPYQLIRNLAARGHEVTVATVCTSEREQVEADELRQHCAGVKAVHLSRGRSLLNCLRATAIGEPLQAHYSWSNDLAEEVEALAPAMDVVHVEHLRGVRYGLVAQRVTDSPVVWDSVDCISYLFEQSLSRRTDPLGRFVNRLELPRTRRYEASLFWRFSRTVITAEADRQAMLALPPSPRPDSPLRSSSANRLIAAVDRNAAISVVPNGVDTSYFTPTEDARDPASVVFSGKMSYHANVCACEHLISRIMPRVWALRPEVKVAVVGKDPPRALRRLADRYGPLVTVTGTVPDVRPFLGRATAAVVPLLYGAGSQFKILEAMACATPVVATPKAVSALDVDIGRDVLVAESTEDFAASLLRLLESPGLQRAVGQAGRRYVETHHPWERIAEQLEAIYQGAVSQPRPTLLASAVSAR